MDISARRAGAQLPLGSHHRLNGEQAASERGRAQHRRRTSSALEPSADEMRPACDIDGEAAETGRHQGPSKRPFPPVGSDGVDQSDALGATSSGGVGEQGVRHVFSGRVHPSPRPPEAVGLNDPSAPLIEDRNSSKTNWIMT